MNKAAMLFTNMVRADSEGATLRVVLADEHEKIVSELSMKAESLEKNAEYLFGKLQSIQRRLQYLPVDKMIANPGVEVFVEAALARITELEAVIFLAEGKK